MEIKDFNDEVYNFISKSAAALQTTKREINSQRIIRFFSVIQ